MYRNVDFVERSKKLADEIIAIERERYRPYYESILKFIRTDKRFRIIVGGEIAINGFIDNVIDINEIVGHPYHFVLYTDKPTELTTELVMHIYNTIPADTVYRSLLISTPVFVGSEYLIRLTNRALCSIQIIGEYRNKSLIDIVRPVKIGGLELLPPEVILIDIYRRIMSADKVEDQDELIATEVKLFTRFSRDILRGKIGGGALEVDQINNGFPVIVALRKALLDKFMAYGRSMIVGKQAIDETKSNDLQGLQICTSLTEEEIREAIQSSMDTVGERDSPESNIEFTKLITELSDSNITIKPVPHLYTLSMPIDHRLRRYRLTVELKKGDKLKRLNLLDIFTAGQYDIIARHPYTLLRFIFVDLWTLNLIGMIGEVAESTLSREIDQLLQLAIRAHALVKPLDEDYKKMYFGSYFDDMLAKHLAKSFSKRDYGQVIYPHVITELGVRPQA